MSQDEAARFSCATHNRIYRDGRLVGEDVPFADLAAARDDHEAVLWLDLLAPSADDVATMTHLAGGDVELHPLALRGLAANRGRPRLMRFTDHKLIHARSTRLDDEQSVRSTSVTVVILDRALITIRSDDGLALDPILEEWDDNADLAKRGVQFLLHAVLEAIATSYLDVLDVLDEGITNLEEDLLDDGMTRDVQVRTFDLRRGIATLARIVLPMNEVYGALARGSVHTLDDPLAPYYQDVYDHALRAAERIDGLRDTIEAILSTGLAMQGNALNETMKKLTAWAAIIAIPTGITGYFGQNVPFPGYGAQWGVVLSAVLLIGLGFGLWLSFKRRGWL